MPTYNDTPDDFNLKYGNTYVLCGDELRFIYHVERMEISDDETEDMVLYNIPGHNKQKTARFDEFPEITPILCDQMFVNTDSGAVKLSRNSRRQNKRSISDDNTRTEGLLFELYQAFGIPYQSRLNLGYDIVQAVLKPAYPSYSDALNSCPKKQAVALNSNFAVTISNMSNQRFLLKSLHGYIGECDAEGLYVKHHPSFQEVLDYVHRNNLPIKVLRA